MTKETEPTLELLQDAARRAAGYLDQLDNRPVAASTASIDSLERTLSGPLPDGPSDAAEILAQLDAFGSPATVASAGGRYFGFVTGGALPATVAATFLTSAWDQNCHTFAGSPAGALYETTALRWLKDVLGLPPTAEGAIVTGATMANFTCLAAARSEVLRQDGWDVESQGLFGAPEITVVVGDEAHATIFKVLAMLGLGRDRVVRVAVDNQGRIRPDAMPPLRRSTILCLQAGNVNSGAFDPADQLISMARSAGAWVHVDGAFGLWALASPEHAKLAYGFEKADSWATDAHKWLNVPYDCGVAMVGDPIPLSRAMSLDAAYLVSSSKRDAINFTPDSSRRARAIEIWAALRALGKSGIADLVRRNCSQATQFAQALRDDGVEILNDVILNQVVAAFGDDTRTRRVIEAVQASGVCWCAGTTWRGRAAMRISVSSWATTERDIVLSLKAIRKAHQTIKSSA